MINGLQTASNARVLYVDMNAFYASIEQQHRPEARNKPVVVSSHISPTATVLASSYEAKALGVRTGLRLKEAHELVPNLLVYETDTRKYRAMHSRFREILFRTFGQEEVRVRSVDEASITLAPNWHGSKHCHDFAHSLKEQFRTQLGEHIRASIGIAPNSFLAKVATDLQKPNGLVEITVENTQEILSRLSLTDLPGIAEAMAANLARKEITSPLELYNSPVEDLRRNFGIWGQYWWWRLHGYEVDGYEGSQKSISHEHVLTKWYTKRDDGWPMLSLMVERIIHRLCNNQFRCRSIGIRVRVVGLPSYAAELKFDAATASYPLLMRAFHDLYNDLPAILPGPVRKLCVELHGLVPVESGLQIDLFQTNPTGERVSTIVERIRTDHGFYAIQTASSMAKKPAELKEQPGFGRVKDRTTY